MLVRCQQSQSYSVDGELSFVDINLHIFQAISRAEVYGRSWLVKNVCYLDQWTSTWHQNFTEVTHLFVKFLYGGFEFKDVSDKLLHKTDKDED